MHKQFEHVIKMNFKKCMCVRTDYLAAAVHVFLSESLNPKYTTLLV